LCPTGWNASISFREPPPVAPGAPRPTDGASKMPIGVEALRDHIRITDDVPLRVSLFTDCSALAGLILCMVLNLSLLSCMAPKLSLLSVFHFSCRNDAGVSRPWRNCYVHWKFFETSKYSKQDSKCYFHVNIM
jgi:hypothetical protein